MINSIELENYKAFKMSGQVNLKKINLFLGPNSSGKSSFLESSLLLKKAIDCSKTDIVIGEKVNSQEYKKMVYKNNMENKINFKLNFDKSDNTEDKEQENGVEIEFLDFKGGVRRIEFTIGLEEKPTVEEFIIKYGENKCRIFLEEGIIIAELDNFILKTEGLIEPYKFYFKVNERKLDMLANIEKKTARRVAKILDKTEKKLKDFSKKFIYIESLRSKIENAEMNNEGDGYCPLGIKSGGLGKTISKIEENKKEKNTLERINYWLDRFDLGDDIKTKREDGNIEVLIRNKNLGMYNDLYHVGFGTKQLLPIIIESVNSPKGSTLILEEPETHIHPRAQANLSDLFVDTALKDDKRFIIETHSIFLVTELQILIAEGIIKNTDVAIYYFDQDENGSKAREMELTENGQFYDEWPTGFFDIHYLLGRKLFDLL